MSVDPGDREVCLCFRVTRRKLEAFVRVQKPRRASQLADCGGAGTGCGWCVPRLRTLFDKGRLDLPSEDDYARGRSDYRGSEHAAADVLRRAGRCVKSS